MAISRFIYPRTISVRRPNVDSATGLQPGYSGNREADEAVVATGIPASIQASASFRASGGDKLPGGAPGPARWRIFVPLSALAKGAVQRDDVIEDDQGDRYLVADPYWNSLGYQIHCTHLKVA